MCPAELLFAWYGCGSTVTGGLALLSSVLPCLNGMSWYLNAALCSKLSCFKAVICIALSFAFLSIVSVECGEKPTVWISALSQI